MGMKKKTGLILTGGGARAAYQIGVLQAISEILWEEGWPPARNPFQIICGTSAGAINATALACRADNFGEGVQKLLDVWSNFEANQVYRADSRAGCPCCPSAGCCANGAPRRRSRYSIIPRW
jgi:NTE family protein